MLSIKVSIHPFCTLDKPGCFLNMSSSINRPSCPSQGGLTEAPEGRCRVGSGRRGRGVGLAAGVQWGPGEPAQRVVAAHCVTELGKVYPLGSAKMKVVVGKHYRNDLRTSKGLQHLRVSPLPQDL